MQVIKIIVADVIWCRNFYHYLFLYQNLSFVDEENALFFNINHIIISLFIFA